MFTAWYSNRFLRQYKKLRKSGQLHLVKKLDAVMQALISGNVLAVRYRNHRLSGKLAEFYECHVAPDWLLVYRIYEEDEVLEFFATGTHSQLFG